MEKIDEERKKLVNNQVYNIEQLYSLITPLQLYFNEIGGYVKGREFISKTNNIKYDYTRDKPFYLFDLRKKYFNDNKILWHVHPFQGEKIWNCYPSLPDLQSMANNPGKIFVLITKCGTFLYFSVLPYRYDITEKEYKNLHGNVFYNIETLNDNPYIKTTGYQILFYNNSIPNHERDVFTNLQSIVDSF